MHLIVPFAAPAAEPAHEVMRGLALPKLRRLLDGLADPVAEWVDEWSLSPPHERAWARAMGWSDLPDGLIPTASWLAEQHGLRTPETADGWALLTPTHWRLGTEQISLADPASLQLEAAESQAYLDAVRELFESEGFSLHMLAPTTWLCRHEPLADLPVASLDRVIGRNIDRWLGADPRARLVRRLQNEVQMLLHEHPLNEAREALGLWPVNSVWLSGCGRLPAVDHQAAAQVTVHEGLRQPALADDAAAWGRAVEAFDADVLPAWQDQAMRSGQGSLTLCGERGSLRWSLAGASLGARLLRATGLRRPPDPAARLQGL